MKIVVIGGTGLIGSKVVPLLRDAGHEAVAASPRDGVDAITGEGLQEALAGAQVVVDLANAPFEAAAVLAFFETSGRNLLAAESAAGVRHHVALSTVGIDRSDNGYFRAKLAQEKLILSSGLPYTIVRSTQFLEFLDGIAASSGADGNTIMLPPGLFQPMRRMALPARSPRRRLPPRMTGSSKSLDRNKHRPDAFVGRHLKVIGDPRIVVRDPEARYFGGRVEERSLVPLGEARLGRIGLDAWLSRVKAIA